MLAQKVKNRIIFLFLLILITVVSSIILLRTLNDNILYFSTPTEIKEKNDIVLEKLMRVGGMVKNNSIKTDSEEIQFIITDLKNEILISYKGTVPNLFAEGKGVVAEGILKDKKFFIANRILAKHDEEYMPPKNNNVKNLNAK